MDKKIFHTILELSDQDLDWMIEIGSKREIPAKSPLIRQGEPVTDFYIITQGEFSVVGHGQANQEIARLKIGYFIGEMSFVNPERPIASVVALEDSAVLAVPLDRLRENVENDQGFASRFFKAIASSLAFDLYRTLDVLANDYDGISTEGTENDKDKFRKISEI